MSDSNNSLYGICSGIDSFFISNNVNSDIGTFTIEESKVAIMVGEILEEPCVCGACVMCSNATEESVPVHILKEGEKVKLGGLAELNKKDILLDMPFAGCKTAEGQICRMTEEDIEDGEWKDVDETKNQGEDKENVKSRSSYMVCTKEWGILYFVKTGQQVKDFVDELSAFMDYLQEQFGFDRRTVGVLGEVYRKIQVKYADRPSKERDWYFARSLSQMAYYDNKLVEKGPFSVETHAWRRGAGWAIEYGEDNAKKFFCDELGIDEADYRYMRQMVRLQHLITSDSEDQYTYNSVYDMSENDSEKFKEWKGTMVDGIGKDLEDDEYLALYEQIYNEMKQKGDFSHMLYTLSANLKDEGDKVQNKWRNIGARETSWDNAEERKDIAGWLGDAVYGGDGKTSFGMDDYIADLDADNIAHMITEEKSLVDAANEYYKALRENGVEYRTEMFVKNNTYKEIEDAILDKLSIGDDNGDGEINYKDILENDNYLDTYKFLARLKPYSEPQ